MSVTDEVNSHRQDVVTDTYTVTWRELVNQYREGDLLISPDYQRLFRWDLDQQTQYIESILLTIPSPPLFFARNEDGRTEVIDGLQRISTVLKFFAADVPPSQDDERQELEQNDITKPTRLVPGKIVASLEGFTASTLPEALVRSIRYARIGITLLERESNRRARYEVFKRLNQFGSPLGDQEIRNCTARQLGGVFPDKLREISQMPVIEESLALSEEAARRMGVDEMVLRLLALSHSERKLKHQVREFLDDFMEFASEGKFKVTPEIESKIERTFQLIAEALPSGNAFRLRKSHGFSTNLFDVVATGIYHNIDSIQSARDVEDRVTRLLDSDELKDVIGAGSNTRRKLEGRVTLGKRWFA